MKTGYSQLFSLFSLVLLFANPGSACECRSLSITEALAQSKAVFVGKVLSVDAKDGSTLFEVTRAWRGIDKKLIRLHSLSHSENVIIDRCEFTFKAGKNYLVYAYGEKVLTTDKCTKTKPLSKAKKEVEVLNERLDPK